MMLNIVHIYGLIMTCLEIAVMFYMVYDYKNHSKEERDNIKRYFFIVLCLFCLTTLHNFAIGLI